MLLAFGSHRSGRDDGCDGVGPGGSGTRPHLQDIAEPFIDLAPLECGAGPLEPAGDDVEHAVDAGPMAGRALNRGDAANVLEDRLGVDLRIAVVGHGNSPPSDGVPYCPDLQT